MMAVTKNKLALIFILMVSFSKAQSEECNFLSSVFKNDDKHFIINKFLNIDKRVNLKEINKSFFIENWTLVNTNETPSIQFFLENFELEGVGPELLISKNTIIYCEKLNLINEVSKKSRCESVYYSITKPIFNKSLDWCLFLKTCSVPETNFYCGGSFEIYRKVNNKWIYYHSVTAWYN